MDENPEINSRLVELFESVRDGKGLTPEELAEVMGLVASNPVLDTDVLCENCVAEGVDEPRPVVAELPLCLVHILEFFAWGPDHDVMRFLRD